jgi:hypothetical protein
MMNDFQITGLLKDWKFRIDEISPSHYQMEGLRRTGETISKEGSDEIRLSEELSIEARKFDNKYVNPQKEPFKEYYFNTDLPRSFPPELRRVILEEILSRNWIQEYWSGYGNGVLLANSFRIPRKGVNPPLEYQEINDPHYWKDEVRLIGTDYFVAAAFRA